MTTASSLRAEVLSSTPALLELEPEWNRLWRAQARREVFTGFHWAAASWEAFGGSRRLRVVAVREGGQLVGLLPLSAGADGLRLLGGHHADYNDLLVAGADPAPVVAAALDAALACREPGPFVLENLPEWSTLCSTLGQLPPSLQARIAVATGPPCPALRLEPDREALLAAMLGKQSLKRHEKKLAKVGPLSLQHLETRDAIQERVPDFFAQHVARRAVAGERSLFLEPASRAFYARLIERLNPEGELRFAVLRVDDRAVAYHLGFEVEGRFTWYKPSFDVDYWDYGAGEVLLKRLLEYVRGRPVAEFDFTRGAESFKDRFSNHAGWNVHWTIHQGAGAAWRAGARRAASSPGEGNGVTSLARRMRRVVQGPWHEAPARLATHVLRPAAEFAWASEEWVASSAPRLRVIDLAATVPGARALEVRGATLRELATLAVQESPVLSLADMPPARARVSHGETVRLAFADGRLAGVAWLARRSDLEVRWEDGTTCSVPLPGPAAVIEVRAADAGVLAALVARVAREVTEDELWLLQPAGASPAALGALGFQERHRMGRSRLLGRPHRTWVTPAR